MFCSPNEEWRPIQSFEGIFEISDHGRVRNLVTGRLLKGAIAHHNYRYVSLKHRHRFLSRSVHRLVAEAFLPPRPTPAHTINHVSGDKADNRPSNLEWATRKEQTAHAIALGLMTADPHLMWKR
jgi:hypothetical protein